jgi:hypothetical protein
VKPVFNPMARLKLGRVYAICAFLLHESAHECRMLCRQNRDGTFTYHRPNLRGQRAHPYRPERDDQPEILVPESQEVVSGDSQESGEVVASSLPAQVARASGFASAIACAIAIAPAGRRNSAELATHTAFAR